MAQGKDAWSLRRWLASLKVYSDRRLLLLGVLGFSSGLPRLLVYSTLSFWLLHAGLTIASVGFFAATSIPYSAKFLWAPLLDRVRLPVLASVLGQRRAWMLLTQLGVMGSLILLSFTDPNVDVWWTAFFAVMVAAFSASQDVVIDAYRVDILEDDEQGAGAAMAVFGYRVGMLVAGAGALAMFAFVGQWMLVYMTMAACMLIGVAATLFGREPERPALEQMASLPWYSQLFDAVWGPFRALMTRRWWWLILAFIMLFKLGDALAGTMLNPFLVKMGFSTLEIASVAKTYGVGASMLGVFIGGWVVRNLGVVRALWLAGFMQMFSNLVFILQAYAGHNVGVLVATIGVENLCGGIGTAAFVAFLSKLCDRTYTATQYALLTALASIVRTVLSSFTGVLAESVGWVAYFGITFVSAVPGLLLLAFLMKMAFNSEDMIESS